VVAAHDLVHRKPDATDAEIREALAGNLCRCTGYEKILDAVRMAARTVRERSDGAGSVWTDEHGGPARNEPGASARRREDGGLAEERSDPSNTAVRERA
jgi:hypothetical protein